MRLAYEGFDTAGTAVTDVIDARDVQEAAEQLRGRGVFITRIAPSAAAAKTATRAVGLARLVPSTRTRRLKQLSSFTRQLHVLVSSGTPIVQALEALERQTSDWRFKAVIGQLRRRVEQGTTLAEAMNDQPQAFHAVYRGLIAAGESSGKLSTILDRLARMTQRQVKVRSTVQAAMLYPSMLVTVSAVVLLLMLVFVLPRFATLFESLDVPVPPTTAVLMLLGEVLRAWWWAVGLGLVAAAGGLAKYLTTPTGQAMRDRLLLRLPVVGRLTRSFITARFARLLGILLDSHLPLLDVLELLRSAIGHRDYVALLDEMERTVTRGEAMSQALAQSDLISPSVCETIRSGEASGKLPPSLLTMADFMDEENEVLIKALASLLEPLILVLLGLFVGLVAMSIFLPLFDLAASGGGAL